MTNEMSSHCLRRLGSRHWGRGNQEDVSLDDRLTAARSKRIAGRHCSEYWVREPTLPLMFAFCNVRHHFFQVS